MLSQPPVVTRQKDLSRCQAHNERHWQLEKDCLGLDERTPFVCECSSAECYHAVNLTMLEYESAHVAPNWYAVLPGHLISQHGSRIVLEHSHFWVVETPEQR